MISAIPGLPEEVKSIVIDIIDAYQQRIAEITPLIENTPLMFNDVQESFLRSKAEREKISCRLRDSLAERTNLRKKDFDGLMQGIVYWQEAEEQKVRNVLNEYLQEQKGLAEAIKENLACIKNSLTQGDIERLRQFQKLMGEITARQKQRKEEVVVRLQEVQKEQGRLAERLRQLLSKERELRVSDLKGMVAEFKDQRRQRIASQEKRKKEVFSMLGKFRWERKEGLKCGEGN